MKLIYGSKFYRTSTVVIGLAASFLAFQQFRISGSKLKFDLYERRLKVFNIVREFCGKVAIEGRIEAKDSSCLYHDTIERHFCLIKKLALILAMSINERSNFNAHTLTSSGRA